MLAAGCSAGGTPSAGPGTNCGTARTAANAPVVIKVTAGSVACSTALKIENEYGAKIRAGQVPGNGGGAPVVVSGWTCQGFNTPEVLDNGRTSQCRHDRTTFVAILSAASGSAAGVPA
jgi:hypothetical protein